MQQAAADRHGGGEEEQAAAAASLARQLTDAHCHPQLDPANVRAVLQLKCSTLAAMSVSHDVDWTLMQQLQQMAGSKVIPGYGIHPWWSHLHASSAGSTWQQLLEAPNQQQLQAALEVLGRRDPVTDSGAYATNRPDRPPPQGGGGGGSGGSGGSSGGGAFTGLHVTQQQQQQQQEQQPEQQQERQCLGAGLRVVPLREWQGRLRQLLADNPRAIVGEIGIDRAATIPGSKARTSLKHQMELLRLQVELACEFRRPVSVHCVRGYGHLLQFFTSLAKQQQQQQQQQQGQGCAPPAWPSAIMLHSYGGSVEEVPRFCAIPGLGPRLYFSFSHAINQRTPDKLRARVAAVPDDRLLIESDQVTPLVIDDGLMSMCRIVADVKGWSLQEAADRLALNFRAFYAQQLADGPHV